MPFSYLYAVLGAMWWAVCACVFVRIFVNETTTVKIEDEGDGSLRSANNTATTQDGLLRARARCVCIKDEAKI